MTRLTTLLVLSLLLACAEEARQWDESLETEPDFPVDYESWLVQRDGHIAREWHDHSRDEQLTFPERITDSGYDEAVVDFKPTYSPDGRHIAFFRRTTDGGGPQLLWKSMVMVMDADGSNLRQLTSGDYMEANPMWTRTRYPNQSGQEGYRITWTRMIPSPVIPQDNGAFPETMQVYWTDIDAEPGDERVISNLAMDPFQFGYSSLRDGRMLVRLEGLHQLALMQPSEVSPLLSVYQPIVNLGALLPTRTLLHKITISPDETKISYMKVEEANLLTNTGWDAYWNSILAYADFDAAAGTISNEVVIADYNPDNIVWYTSWSPNNEQLIFVCGGDCPDGHTGGPFSSGQVYEYDVKSGGVRNISGQRDSFYRYPDIWGTVK